MHRLRRLLVPYRDAVFADDTGVCHPEIAVGPGDGKSADAGAEHFPRAETTGSDWAFSPISDAFTDVSGDVTADFEAILYGDVTGNWQPLPPLGAGASVLGPGEPIEPIDFRLVLPDHSTVVELRQVAKVPAAPSDPLD